MLAFYCQIVLSMIFIGMLLFFSMTLIVSVRYESLRSVWKLWYDDNRYEMLCAFTLCSGLVALTYKVLSLLLNDGQQFLIILPKIYLVLLCDLIIVVGYGFPFGPILRRFMDRIGYRKLHHNDKINETLGVALITMSLLLLFEPVIQVGSALAIATTTIVLGPIQVGLNRYFVKTVAGWGKQEFKF